MSISTLHDIAHTHRVGIDQALDGEERRWHAELVEGLSDGHRGTHFASTRQKSTVPFDRWEGCVGYIWSLSVTHCVTKTR
jgi:hypothetical protein